VYAGSFETAGLLPGRDCIAGLLPVICVVEGARAAACRSRRSSCRFPARCVAIPTTPGPVPKVGAGM